MGSIFQWRVSTTSMLLYLLLQAFVLRSSFVSAEFLTPVPEHGNAIMPDLCQEDTVMSCNLVQVDLARLQDSSMDFMGTTLDFKDMPGNNTYTFSSGFSEASFTVDTDLDVVWGHVQLSDGRDFIIEPNLDNCDGCHVVIEENEEGFPQDNVEDLPSLDNEETRSNVAALLEKGKSDSTTVVTYTIMLYYTPEARHSVDDMRTLAEDMIAKTNQGYMNSQIPLRAKLHCMEETKKPEAHFTKGSGHMLNVFAMYLGGGNNLRRSADAAVLLVKDASPMCGWGAVISDGDYANKMVSLTQLSCAEAGYTFGHELGHNMGLQHDKYSPRAGSRIVTPYSQGYHIPGTMFHTILAYPNDDQTVAANYYSNPRLAVGQYVLGKAGEADAAKRMTEVRFAIAENGDESEVCQLPGCIIEEQIGYYDANIAINGLSYTLVEDQNACARLSLKTHGSYFWSYVPSLGACFLKATNSDRRHYPAVSGNSECGRH